MICVIQQMLPETKVHKHTFDVLKFLEQNKKAK